MWLFTRRSREDELARKEAEIQAIRHDTLTKIDTAKRGIAVNNDLIEKNGGITELIYAATHGVRSHSGKR